MALITTDLFWEQMQDSSPRAPGGHGTLRISEDDIQKTGAPPGGIAIPWGWPRSCQSPSYLWAAGLWSLGAAQTNPAVGCPNLRAQGCPRGGVTSGSADPWVHARP